MATDLGKVGIMMRGTWDSSTAYEVLDAVSYNNGLYIAKQAVPANTAPTNTTYWQAAMIPAFKVKTLNYLYSAATVAGTVYTVNNAKTDVFGLAASESFGGFAIFSVSGNQNVCYNMNPVFNASANTFSFNPTANNSGAVRFNGLIFYS